MPQAIPAIAKFVAGATIKYLGASAAVANTVYVAATAALYATPIALARVSAQRQAKKMERALAGLRDQGTTATFADPLASARICYGEMRVGGTTVFAHTTGTKNETLHLVVVHCLDGVSEMGEVYYGDEALGMPWNAGSPPNVPNVSSRFYGKVMVNKKANGGSADADLVTAAPTKWTSNHKLTGLCSTYHRMTWDADVFPQGAGFNISVMIKGRACYDPRTTTTVWTQNPALIGRDYLVNFLGVSTAEIDDADVIAAANECDETVTIADATTQKRYTCNLLIDTADHPADNRQKIAACMAGYIAKIGGKWRMGAGAHKSSSLAITPSMIRGAISFKAQDDIHASFNGVRAVYLDPANNWQPGDATPVIKSVTAPNITAGARCTILSVGTTNFTAIGASSNTVGVTFTATGAGAGTGTVDPYLGADNGVRRWRDIELYGTTNHAEARRLMRIELERARHELTVVVPLMAHGLTVQAGDYVDLTDARYGWTNKLFQVVQHDTVFDVQENGVAVGADLTLREVSSAIYDRTSADETTADPAPNTDMQRPWDIAAPTSLVLASGTTELVKLKDGTVLERLKASWTAPADPYVTGGGRIEVAWKKSADIAWLPSQYAPGSTTSIFLTPVLQGTDYDVRIRSINPLGVTSDWVLVEDHTLIGKSEEPNPPTSLTATAAPGAVIFKCIAPNDPDVSHINFYVAATSTKPADPTHKVPAIPGAEVTLVVQDLAGGDVRYGRASSEDTSGNESATDIGPANATAEDTASPTYLYRGPYASGMVYYDNDETRSVVSVGSSYYVANNAAKNGLTTWSTPPSSDWETFNSVPDNTSTGLLSGSGELAATLSGTLARFGTRSFFLSGPGGGSAFMMLRKAGDPVGDMSIGLFHTGTDVTIELGAIPTTGPYSPTIRLRGSTGAALFGDVTCGAIGMTGTLTIGADCNLYRASANVLRTNDSLTVDGTLTCGTFSATTLSVTTLDATNVNASSRISVGISEVSYIYEAGSGAIRFGSNLLAQDRDLSARSFLAAAGGTLSIGSDCSFYRSAADTIRTADSLTVDGTLTIGTLSAASLSATNSVIVGAGTLTYMYPTANGVRFGSNALAQDRDVEARSVYALSSGSLGIGADCSFYRNAADVIRTADSLTVDGTLTVGTFSTASISATNSVIVGSGTQTYMYPSSIGVRFGSNALAQDRTVEAGSVYAASGGALGIGADCTFYRYGADQIGTTDSLVVLATLYIGTGADCNLYRSTTDTLKTDDAFIATNSVTIDGTGATLTLGSDCSIYRSAANVIRTGDKFKADGALETADHLLISATENTYIYNIGSGVVRFGSSLLDRNRGIDCSSLATTAPSGSSTATWRFGAASTTTPTSPNRTIAIEVGGTTYYLHAKTTND